MTDEMKDDMVDGEEDDNDRPKEEEPVHQPRMRDLDKPEELHQFWIEFKDKDSIEIARCHEVVVLNGAVRFLLRLKAGGAFLAVMYPLDRIQTIEEQLYEEDEWYFDHEYRILPW